MISDDLSVDTPVLPPATRRSRLLAQHRITLLIDAGANTGQFAQRTRLAGYRGRIVSFEPLHELYSALTRNSAADRNWSCRCMALGNQAGIVVMNVAGDSYSNSLLTMNSRHLSASPEASRVRSQETEIARLDSLWPVLAAAHDRTYLKVDVEGYELEVLKGAAASLDRVEVLELELSLTPLFDGGPIFTDVLDYLRARHFDLVSVEGIFDDPQTGHMLQVDAIFVRKAIALR